MIIYSSNHMYTSLYDSHPMPHKQASSDEDEMSVQTLSILGCVVKM